MRDDIGPDGLTDQQRAALHEPGESERECRRILSKMPDDRLRALIVKLGNEHDQLKAAGKPVPEGTMALGSAAVFEWDRRQRGAAS